MTRTCRTRRASSFTSRTSTTSELFLSFFLCSSGSSSLCLGFFFYENSSRKNYKKKSNRPWVQGNYSGLLVQLSSVYSALRGDASGVKNEDASQGFVRSTTKYWVRTFEDLFSRKNF